MVAVMSGFFVQRGEPAVARPHARAEILVRSGFDAVVELPFPYAAAGAEFFGAAGVEILERLGVDEIWFGSECGDVDALARCAAIADSDAFQARYAESVQSNEGTARAYFDLLGEMCAEEAVSFEPNDILALSYLRAIRKTGANLRPVTVKRKGSGYAEQKLGSGFPSATALRRAWLDKGLEAIRDRLPQACYEILACEVEMERAPANLYAAERLILGHLRLQAKDTPIYAELKGGLAQRLAHAARAEGSLEYMFKLCGTKKYTDARLRRGVLFSLCGIEESDLRAPVAYTRLLAANGTGCAFIGGVRKSATLPVVTRAVDIPENGKRQKVLEERARDMWTLMTPTAVASEYATDAKPVILL